MPCWRQISAVLTPAWACFKTAMICSSLWSFASHSCSFPPAPPPAAKPPGSSHLPWTGFRGQGHSASPNSWIFPSTRGTPIRTGNWLQRNLKPAAEAAGLEEVTIQALRRTFATLIQKVRSVKDAQVQLRHASPQVTLGVYMKAIPESVRQAVEALYAMLHPKMYPATSSSREDISEVVQ